MNSTVESIAKQHFNQTSSDRVSSPYPSALALLASHRHLDDAGCGNDDAAPVDCVGYRIGVFVVGSLRIALGVALAVLPGDDAECDQAAGGLIMRTPSFGDGLIA